MSIYDARSIDQWLVNFITDHEQVQEQEKDTEIHME